MSLGRPQAFHKAVMVGNTLVGKTSIAKRLERSGFRANQQPTSVGSFAHIAVQGKGGEVVRVGLWDTAGQEHFRSLVPMYFKDAKVLILVFDLTDEASFMAIDQWVQMAQESAPDYAKIVLVGNKNDLMDERVVNPDDAENKKMEIKAVAFVETSAKTGEGIEALEGAIVAALDEFTRGDERGPVTVEPSAQQQESESCC